jgi:hypothetical protein
MVKNRHTYPLFLHLFLLTPRLFFFVQIQPFYIELRIPCVVSYSFSLLSPLHSSDPRLLLLGTLETLWILRFPFVPIFIKKNSDIFSSNSEKTCLLKMSNFGSKTHFQKGRVSSLSTISCPKKHTFSTCVSLYTHDQKQAHVPTFFACFSTSTCLCFRRHLRYSILRSARLSIHHTCTVVLPSNHSISDTR